MVDVKVLARKHYSGVDADKAGVAGVLGDTYAANDSGKFYYWNDSLSAWKTGLGYEYVPREVPAIDLTIAGFPNKDAWQVNGLDLTGIVPAGAVAVHLAAKIRGTATNLAFGLRANATTKAFNSLELTTQVANLYTHWIDFVVYIDVDRLVDYLHQTNLNWIGVNILGWYI